MKKKEVISYFDQEWKHMKRSLNSYLKNKVQADLHQFRVQVKKLHALLVLSDYCRGHPKLVTHFKPVKKVFKCAGVLRNAYICQKLTLNPKPAEKAARSFRSHKAEYWKKIKKTYRRIITKIKRLRSTVVESFYEIQLRQIANALAALPAVKQLHACRKRIKFLLYNDKLFHDQISIHLNVEYLDRLQETIGEWHDQLLTVATTNTNTLTIKKLNNQEARLTVSIRQQAENFYQSFTYR